MSCSDQQDFCEQVEKISFGASTDLYQFLSTRLHKLASSIKTCLDFVSSCILYLLGFNHQMFTFCTFGNGNGASNKTKEIKEHSNATKFDDLDEIRVCDIKCSSDQNLLKDSCNNIDYSDSETTCCFDVKRLRKLILRRTNQRLRNHSNSHPNKINTKDSKTSNHQIQVLDNDEIQLEAVNSEKHQLDKTDFQHDDKKTNVPSDCISGERNEGFQADKLQQLCTEVTKKAFPQINAEGKSVNRSPKSVFTKTTSPVTRSPRQQVSEPSCFQTRTSPKEPTTVSPVSQIYAASVPLPSSPNSESPTLSPTSDVSTDFDTNTDIDSTDDDDRPKVIGVVSVSTSTCSANSILFSQILAEVSNKPLEKYEEANIRDVFNRGLTCDDDDPLDLAKYDRFDHIKRLFCIVSQALRQKLKTRDPFFDDAIHKVRRSIKIYVDQLSINKDPYIETLYFKQLTHFYRLFKQCAFVRNHDISRFIKKAKDLQEMKFLINSDKEMATAVRKLNPSESEEQLTSIRLLFRENSENVQPDADHESKQDEADKIIVDNESEGPTCRSSTEEVIEYLSGLCVEESEANKSFQDSVGCLANHFARLAGLDTPTEPDKQRHLPSSTPNEKNSSFNVRGIYFKPQSNMIPKQSGKTTAQYNLTKPLTTTNATTRNEHFMTTPVLSNQDTNKKADSIPNFGFQMHSEPNSHIDTCIKPENIKSNHVAAESASRTEFPPYSDNYFGNAEVLRDLMIKEYQDIDFLRPVTKRNLDDMDSTIARWNEESEDLKRVRLEDMTQPDRTGAEESQNDQEREAFTNEARDHNIPAYTVKTKETSDTQGLKKKTPPPVPTKPACAYVRKTEDLRGKKKKEPPPIPKKPTPGITCDWIDIIQKAKAESRLHKTLQDQPHRQAPPVPVKPDTSARRTASQNRAQQVDSSAVPEFQDPVTIHSNNENNSFTTERKTLPLSDEDDRSCLREHRILQDISSFPDHQQEIVIKDSTGYEVVLNKFGTETFVPNILDFEFNQYCANELLKENSQDEKEICVEHTTSASKRKQPTEHADEKYEEHFEIDTSVYDQSGCKIMPGSGVKVNRKKLESNERRKTKTKGVANKHLLKAFNDADQNQEFLGDEIDDELLLLDELDDFCDDDSDKCRVDSDNENKNNHEVSEPVQDGEDVNVGYVEDVRHWQMLPTEVRRKNDVEDDYDDKYRMPSKGTPDEKKKGKKKKEKKQKAVPMSLLELSFQFQ